MLVKNAALRGRNELYNIYISDGRIAKLVPSREDHEGNAAESANIIDASGNMVLPPFIDPHIHLDTTLTAGEPNWNISGTLFEGIERWAERKEMLSREDIKSRAKKALEWQIANGVQYVRSHVDTTDPALTAVEALLELKDEMKEYINLQLVAFPQEGILSYPGSLELMKRAIEMGVDAVGAIPHFEYQRDYGVESLKIALDLALKYDRLVDVHCDEIDDEQSRFVEVLASEALQREMGHRVTASHTTAMGSYNDAYSYKLFRVLKRSGVSFVANPLVNIHLGGRFDTYPKRRGLTRVKELYEAGINVCFGQDDIFDPWYPLGNASMLQVLHMGLHAAHMMGYEDIKKSIDFITVNSARTLNVTDLYGIEAGKPANFIILSENNEFDIIRLQASVTYSVRGGKIIARTEPKKSRIMTDREKEITFKRE